MHLKTLIAGAVALGLTASCAKDEPLPDPTSITDNSPFSEKELFLYDLSDYCNPEVPAALGQEKEIKRKYLDQFSDPTVFYFWTPGCYACRDNFPKINELAAQYSGKINFVGVLVQDDLEKCESASADAEQMQDEFRHFWQKNPNAMDPENYYTPFLENWAEDTQTAQGTASHLCYDFASAREAYCMYVQTKERHGKLSFPSMVLDNQDTREYLLGDQVLTQPHLLLLKDGAIVDQAVGKDRTDFLKRLSERLD